MDSLKTKISLVERTLLGAKGIATRSKDGLTTRNKKATRSFFAQVQHGLLVSLASNPCGPFELLNLLFNFDASPPTPVNSDRFASMAQFLNVLRFVLILFALFSF